VGSVVVRPSAAIAARLDALLGAGGAMAIGTAGRWPVVSAAA
jgi:hypothetical protein